MVANKSRTFDLQADNKEKQMEWLAALQKAKPEIYAQVSHPHLTLTVILISSPLKRGLAPLQPVAMKLSAKDKKALEASLLTSDKRITVELAQPGPLGVSFQEEFLTDSTKEPGCAYILSVKAGSQAAAIPGSPLSPGMKLTKVGDTPLVGIGAYSEVSPLEFTNQTRAVAPVLF